MHLASDCVKSRCQSQMDIDMILTVVVVYVVTNVTLLIIEFKPINQEERTTNLLRKVNGKPWIKYKIQVDFVKIISVICEALSPNISLRDGQLSLEVSVKVGFLFTFLIQFLRRYSL